MTTTWPGEKHFCITGTRNQPTPWQLSRLEKVLSLLSDDYDVMHHGGCTGADLAAHFMAVQLGFAIEVHPGPQTNITPFIGHTIHPRKPNLERNHDMVLVSKLVVAVPGQRREILRSGTWATVRFARSQKVGVEVIYP